MKLLLMLVEDLLSSVSASEEFRAGIPVFCIRPQASESFFSRCSPESFSLSRVALIFTKGIDNQV